MARELKVIEVGLDLGNYEVNTAMRHCDGKIKTAKLPVAHSLTKPPGSMNEAGRFMKAKVFSLIFDGQEHWFGPDVLNHGDYEVDHHLMDEYKYGDPEYLRRVALAAIYNWHVKNKVEFITAGVVYRLNVSMPPEDYANNGPKNLAQKAYRSAFDTETPLYIKTGKDKARRINIKLGYLRAETVGYLTAHRRKHGDETVLLVDIGGGTEDKALYLKGQYKPYTVRSRKDTGLVHAYEAAGGNRKEVERNILNGGQWPRALSNHIRKVADDIKVVKRKLNGHYFSHLVVMGGGASLIKANNQAKALFNDITDNVFLLDEYINAIANLENAEHDRANS